MICKGCGRQLSVEETVRMVAQWPFCESCFAQLLAPRDSGDRTTPPAKAADAPACGLCGAPLNGDGRKVGIWQFCDRCFTDLISPSMPESNVEQTEAEAETEPAPLPPNLELHTLIACAGCGRRVPLGGSREAVGGRYCPECFAGLPKEEKQITVRMTPSIDSEEQRSCCESCGRTLPPERLQAMEGFVLCSACVAADAELALTIARKRHRARLMAIRTYLDNPGAPDPKDTKSEE